MACAFNVELDMIGRTGAGDEHDYVSVVDQTRRATSWEISFAPHVCLGGRSWPTGPIYAVPYQLAGDSCDFENRSCEQPPIAISRRQRMVFLIGKGAHVLSQLLSRQSEITWRARGS